MKWMAWFNFAGVIALAVLCAAQWQFNRKANLRVIDLETTTQTQAGTLAEEQRTIKGNMADLDDFRRRLEQSDAELRKAEGKIADLDAQLAKTTRERDAAVTSREQLLAEQKKYETTLQTWVSAVDQRDDLIKKANAEIQKLAAQRNEAVTKFNDLATKYNAIVKELNGKKG